MMRDEYLPRARTTLAAVDAARRRQAYYQAMIEKFTTLDLTAQQIHDIGLEGGRAHRGGDAGNQAAGRLHRHDGGVLHTSCAPTRSSTPRRRASCSPTRPTSPRRPTGSSPRRSERFLPRDRHGIRPVPDALAPIYTGGRGGLESCLMNTYNLPARPLYTLASLTLHECTPGHSFQAALAARGSRASAVPSRHVVLRLRRRVGALHRMARHRHGDLRDSL